MKESSPRIYSTTWTNLKLGTSCSQDVNAKGDIESINELIFLEFREWLDLLIVSRGSRVEFQIKTFAIMLRIRKFCWFHITVLHRTTTKCKCHYPVDVAILVCLRSGLPLANVSTFSQFQADKRADIPFKLHQASLTGDQLKSERFRTESLVKSEYTQNSYIGVGGEDVQQPVLSNRQKAHTGIFSRIYKWQTFPRFTEKYCWNRQNELAGEELSTDLG